MKKILAISLVLIMCIFSFASCTSAEDLLKSADEALLDAPYKMTVKADFSTDNEDFSEILNALSFEVPVIRDGDNMLMEMSMDMFGDDYKITMTLIGKTLYYKVDAAGETMKAKAELSTKEYKEFMAQNDVSMPVDHSSFEEFSVEEKNGKTIITCSNLSEDAIDDIIDNLRQDLGGLDDDDYEIDISDIDFEIVIKDKKYDSMKFSCAYEMAFGDEELTLDMSFEAEFEYDDIDAVKKPSGASKYTEVDFDELGL